MKICRLHGVSNMVDGVCHTCLQMQQALGDLPQKDTAEESELFCCKQTCQCCRVLKYISDTLKILQPVARGGGSNG